jgi:hypothetical protein
MIRPRMKPTSRLSDGPTGKWLPILLIVPLVQTQEFRFGHRAVTLSVLPNGAFL